MTSNLRLTIAKIGKYLRPMKGPEFFDNSENGSTWCQPKKVPDFFK